jgi:hypothetical protein
MNTLKYVLEGVNYRTYGKGCKGNHLPDTVPINNGLKEGDALPPLLFNYASGYSYVIRSIKT